MFITVVPQLTKHNHIGNTMDTYSGNYDYKHIDCLGTEVSLSSCSVTNSYSCIVNGNDAAGVRCILKG